MNWLENLSKILPVDKIYEDIAQPAFREIGDAARSSVRAARFLLAPVDYLAAHQVRWQRWLKKINDQVPEKNLILAHPQLTGPAIEGLRYLEEENILAELFVNLLARSIDKDRVSEAHPAFAKIIAQLSPDEALIIYLLNKEERILKQYSKYFHKTSTFGPREIVENHFPLAKLAYPQNYFMYMDHLFSLNLAGVWQHGNQEPIMKNGLQTGVNITSYAQLTPFGKLFSKACLPNNIDEWTI
ncbi:DUF4393 domain-containing protein [Desulfobulbus oligotrophicus]|uniref:DUF4393 domain-containing protein n=1 Tax=Desulfobulbus oligotrophicus TaxID=1909699 RepID=A0A7T5VD16_9BACT|nr:DUF4393 domain-containing protein [Desulfobulbus oligotrophicus]QQG65652.1 DUF4393 domain-containing protein [Desulfobulbus oligotrophicus]